MFTAIIERKSQNVPDNNENVPEEILLANIRSLLYVAITRARQIVFITGYGEATGLLESE